MTGICGGDVADLWLRRQVGRFAPGQDEGGPGDSPVSVRWIQEGAPTREQERWRDWKARPRFDPESGTPIEDRRHRWISGRWLTGASPRTSEGSATYGVGGPPMLDRPIDRLTSEDGGGPGDESAAARRWAREQVAMRADRSNSIMRMPPAELLRPAADPRRPGSTVGLSDWERWLEMCARIDGFPRHLSIHSGGMLVTAAPLIDIAPIERATMADRVVVQYDKRDVETMKLIKLDLLGLGMLAAIDETLQLIEHDCAACLDLDRIPEEIPEVFAMLQAADTVGRVPGRESGADADAAEVAADEPRRSRRGGRDHPAGPDPGQRRPSIPAAEAGPGAGHVPPPGAGAGRSTTPSA